MKGRVYLFAGARARAGVDRLEIELPPGATVADARAAIARQAPALGDFLARCAVAVNEEVAGDEVKVPEGAELALLPPVSGG